MGKRKRDVEVPQQVNGHDFKAPNVPLQPSQSSPVTVQIVTGSYERVLHGFQAAIPLSLESENVSVQFVDIFLFNAHSSAIRCLALSPLPDQSTAAENVRITLASGGTDERINLYSLSASPLTENDKLPSVPTLAGNKILENPANRELGSLLQHASSITAIYFPTRSKVIAAAEDNTISISRTKDFEVVSTIKAPRPKVQGRPSGDTAPPGAQPVGVNDFAVHPSMKLMVSVGKGEKCMRLWNLVTGKKAGVLNFGRDVLESVREGKYSNGEGRKIEWRPDGEEFAVAFERGVVVYGVDSVPTCRVLPMPLTKIHQMKYVQANPKDAKPSTILAVSTEDGRIVLYSTTKTQTEPATNDSTSSTSTIPSGICLAELGGKAAGLSGRIKDFEVLNSPSKSPEDLLVVTASSDGTVRIWAIKSGGIMSTLSKKAKSDTKSGTAGNAPAPKQVGRLIGTYETGNRITCLKAFVMLPPTAEDELVETEAENNDDESEEDEDAEEASEDGD